jgi:hypothetical protein
MGGCLLEGLEVGVDCPDGSPDVRVEVVFEGALGAGQGVTGRACTLRFWSTGCPALSIGPRTASARGRPSLSL